MFTDNKILYIGNLKHTMRKLLEFTDEFGKVAGCKINIQKSVVLLYTNNKVRKRTKETVPLTITPKKINY